MREYLLSKQEMQTYDANTINKIGIPKEVLMERAALAVFDYVCEQFTNLNRDILVVAGNGNNGGDAVAVARLLTEKGYKVDLYITAEEEDYSEVIKFQTDIAKKYGVKILSELGSKEYDIIIDGLFGIGLNRQVAGDYSGLIKKLNKKNGYKISIDIPSGIDCDTGEVLGTAFSADTTITFGYYKRGLLLREGPRHAGFIVRASIGITDRSFYGKTPEMFMYMYDDAHNGRIDVGRNPQGNKGTFGKVLIIAGRTDTSGACVLAAMSALRSGCGMVSVLTEESNRGVMIAALPECIVHSYRDKSEIEKAFREGESWADVIAVGPGIGTDDIGLKLLNLAIFESNKPLIVDADGINILARNKRLKIQLLDRLGNADTKRTLIFTPHIKEFARLSEKSMEEIAENKTELCQFFSKQFHCILALKDAYTLVCEDDNIYINIISNDGMATAGSGDVLTGLIASLVSQYIRKSSLVEYPEATKDEFSFYAAAMGVYVHSRAGIKASEMNGRSSMIASDVINKYGEVLM